MPLGEETGEVTERKEVLLERRLVEGPSGLLKRLVKLGVPVVIEVSLAVSVGSFNACWQ